MLIPFKVTVKVEVATDNNNIVRRNQLINVKQPPKLVSSLDNKLPMVKGLPNQLQ